MRTSKTVTAILSNPNLRKRLAVARGWEKLPEIGGDLDLFVRNSDWSVFEMYFAGIARSYGWDELVLDRSWANGHDYSRILVFYFRMKDGGECLQVDLFNGFSVLGCGLLDANTILNNSASFEDIMIPSMEHFKELREFQIYRHLKWFRHTQNHKVLEHMRYFQISHAQNSRLKSRIFLKRFRIVFVTLLMGKKINIIDRLNYYMGVVIRFRHDTIYDAELNSKEWTYASRTLLRNKYARNQLIIKRLHVGNMLKALKTIERNGILIILKNKDVDKINRQSAIGVLTKLKYNQSYCK